MCLSHPVLGHTVTVLGTTKAELPVWARVTYPSLVLCMGPDLRTQAASLSLEASATFPRCQTMLAWGLAQYMFWH